MRLIAPALAIVMLMAFAGIADAGAKKKTKWQLYNCSEYDVDFKIQGPHGKEWTIFVEAGSVAPFVVWHPGEYCFTVCPDLEEEDLVDGFQDDQSEPFYCSIWPKQCKYVRVEIDTTYDCGDIEELDYYFACYLDGNEPAKQIQITAISRDTTLSLLAMAGLAALGGAGLILSRCSA